MWKILSPHPFRALTQSLLRLLRKTPADQGSVDAYWNRHTVNSTPFKSAQESSAYLEWRFGEYPLFREFMGLYGDHDGETVLDYGCGPGNDLVGFLTCSRAAKVIGVDVSEKALNLARERLALHEIDPSRFALIRKTDADSRVPLDPASVDYLYCEGVLHHPTDPGAILREFARVLKSGGASVIMVYNKDSVWRHLYTAYMKVIVENAFPGLSLDDAFARNTDGEECPISRSYRSGEFASMCRGAGFEVEYRGGYLSKWELRVLAEQGAAALADPRLPQEQREFLKGLTADEMGYPLYGGKHAGIGGVYALRKLA